MKPLRLSMMWLATFGALVGCSPSDKAGDGSASETGEAESVDTEPAGAGADDGGDGGDGGGGETSGDTSGGSGEDSGGASTGDEGGSDGGSDDGSTTDDIDWDSLNGFVPDPAGELPDFVAYHYDTSTRSREDLLGDPTVMWFYPAAATAG